MNTLICRLALPALLWSATAQGAVLYDLVSNFNSSNNPDASSTFSYGFGANPASFSLDTATSTSCFSQYGSGVGACSSNGNNYPDVDFKGWNNTGVTINSGSVSIPTTDLILDPTGTAGNIVRFTAPVAGIYSLNGNFEADDTSHRNTTVDIFVKSVLSYSNTVGGFGSVDPFSLTGLSLAVGDKIDFIVISGGGTDFLSTGLNGTITGPSISTGTPEPDSILLLAGSLPLLAWFGRKRANWLTLLPPLKQF